MAQATIPRDSFLDRPLAPSTRWVSVLLAHRELVAYSTIFLAGFLLRIWDVGTRALHHDESLHAYYAWKLFVGQGYTYDPLMHGPFQFEVVPLFYLLFGDSEFSARLLAVILGTVMIPLPYLLRHHLTRPGALLASLMLAVGPVFVYFSRFIRDDIYLACFALALFVCAVRYMETHEHRYLYVGAAMVALAVASMEAAYLLIFIFGTFFGYQALREFLAERSGPVLRAVRATSLDAWLTAIAIFVVITVVLYSTFFTNPYGIWDPRFSLMSPDRKDILGGLTYWQAQHGVARGGQPWFYYLLVLPLYQQLAVVFGIAGAVYAVVHRTLFNTFLLWWAVGSLLLYSWAGEKMPWLSMHIALPFVLLAGLFAGKMLLSRRTWVLLGGGSLFAALFALELHSTFALSFRDGANPTEMMIYVQTSQDVPNVAHELNALSQRVTRGPNLAIGLDNNDVGGWPFIWYLRHDANVTETSSFSGPVCGGQYCPVLLMLGPEYDQYGGQLAKRYVAQKYRWNWWFPEDYKVWFPQHVGSIAASLAGRGSLVSDPIGTPTDWQHVWNWMVYRQPFADRGARWLYVLVRRDLVPGAKYFSTVPLSGAQPPAPVSQVPSLSAVVTRSLGGVGVINGPRGVASDSRGHVYVADPPNHRIVELTSSGTFLRSWGSVGTAPGQFNTLDSPQALAVARNGDVYVADTWNQRIQVFSSRGTFVRQWGGGAIGSGQGQFYGPRSIAIAPHGLVYVADTGNERIQVFTPSGQYVRSWGGRGTAEGQFMEPSSVAVAANGTVYVADFWNQRIQAFSPSGTFERAWSVPDWTPHSYDEPYLTVDQHSGTVYATEPQQQRVLAWRPTGQVVGAFGSGQLSLPVGVTTEPDGRVAVSDATSGKVDVFTITSARGVAGMR